MTLLSEKQQELRSTPGAVCNNPYFLCIFETLWKALDENDNPEVKDTVEKCLDTLMSKYRNADNWSEEDWAKDEIAFNAYNDPEGFLDKVA